MGVLNQTMLTTQLTWENKLLSVLKVAGSLKKKERKRVTSVAKRACRPERAGLKCKTVNILGVKQERFI